MHHIITTLTAVAATLATFVDGIPLANGAKHARFHAARALDIKAEPEYMKLAPVEAKRDVPSVQLDLMGGTCGGSTGFGCAEGFCCSKWGYCGTSEAYCGDAAASNSTLETTPEGPTHAVSAADEGPHSRPHGRPHGRPHHWGGPKPAPTTTKNDLPEYTPPVPPPVWTSPPETSVAAPAPTTTSSSPAVQAPAPSTYVPVPEPTSAAPEPTSAAAEPSPYEPAPSAPSNPGSGAGYGDVYREYFGNGANWPTEDQWASFENLWSDNVPLIKISCEYWGQENPSDQEVAETKSAIQQVAGETGVDSRFILAVMMQESKGCVRVPSTINSHPNPGLFQSYMGTGSCNPDGTGMVPCPTSQIKQMVSDGIAGTASGPGMKQNMEECSSTGSQQYYEAARIYNSGSIPASGDLGAPGATRCYAMDIANRLTGWTDTPSGCTLDG